ncbi:septal ring lytic transglycosylase RlpA family protein [Coleofasciculus sp. FACHB-64]|nr:septal ring lytic transglycosylase RlpA family protein [Coleofasciculus sp. FACHB-64]MBD1841627.1 septal ring lytic transglycosylase RlpA family protein [Coleofasciculus sp. FACHB-501]MBD2049054.1 septal ring lytic transglycosylase RlpA family protein [Coleofasciculus sp. FACHB-64]
MNQRFCFGMFSTLLTTALLGTTTSSYAESIKGVNQASESRVSQAQQTSKSRVTKNDLRQAVSSPLLSTPSNLQPTNGVKLGEYQSQSALRCLVKPCPSAMDRAVVAKILPHELNGYQAATLYVRSIPVLTFLGSRQAPAESTKVGEAQRTSDGSRQADANTSQDNPVWRATAVAAKLNQLSRDQVDAKAIAVVWNGDKSNYSIKVNGEELVEVNGKTRLPDTTRNVATDALQATNRLRRLMGNAPPLRAIAGVPTSKPKPRQIAKRPSASRVANERSRVVQQPSNAIAYRPVISELKGMASWYGYAGNGTQSASGERFNENAMTAAHRTLPFGTQVRVTNTNNGRSVVVRINDRGPFIRGRIIDVSAGAARVLGMISSGVAPVRVEILGKPQKVAVDDN